MEDIKISIIVPVYNVEKYLKKSMDNIVNQTLKDIEIICINDGSTDNSLSILENYAKNDPRIIIINKKNEGVAIARNTGIAVAKGEYIGCSDPDDWIELDMYEKMYNQAKKLDSDIVICDYIGYVEAEDKFKKLDFWKIAEKQNKKKVIEVTPNVNLDKEVIYKSLLVSPGYSWNKIYKAKLIKDNNIKYGTSPKISDDIFSLRAQICANRISYIKEPLYVYNIRQGSIVRNLDDGTYGFLFNVFDDIRDCLIKENLMDELRVNFEHYVTCVGAWYERQLPKHNLRPYKKYFLRDKEYQYFLKYMKRGFRYHLGEFKNKLYSKENTKTHKIVKLAGIKLKFKKK